MHKPIKFIYAVLIITIISGGVVVGIINRIDGEKEQNSLLDDNQITRVEMPRLAVRNLEIDNDNSLPVFDQTIEDQNDRTIANKINNELQKKIIGTTFDNPLWGIEYYHNGDKDEKLNIHPALEYAITYPLTNIIQIRAEKDWCIAYCSSGKYYYIFDRQTGNLISISDLLTPFGLKSLEKRINEYQRKVINDFITPLKNGTPSLDGRGKNEIQSQIDLYQECLENYKDDKGSFNGDFYLNSDGNLVFVRENCFSHVNLDLDDIGEFEMTQKFKDLEPFLTPYGKSILRHEIEQPLSKMDMTDCTWDRYTSPYGDISLWRKDCIDETSFLEKPYTNYITRYYNEGYPDKYSESDIKIEPYNKKIASSPEQVLNNFFIKNLELTGLQKENRCIVKAVKINSPYKLPSHKMRFEVTLSDEDWVKYQNKFGTDVPPLPCGEYGVDPDGSRYFEFDDRSPSRYLFIKYGNGWIEFDPDTIRF